MQVVVAGASPSGITCPALAGRWKNGSLLVFRIMHLPVGNWRLPALKFTATGRAKDIASFGFCRVSGARAPTRTSNRAGWSPLSLQKSEVRRGARFYPVGVLGSASIGLSWFRPDGGPQSLNRDIPRVRAVISASTRIKLLVNQTPKCQHSVSLQSPHAAHGYTLSNLDLDLDRLKVLLRVPNDDYWFVFPPVWTAPDEKEADDDAYEDPYALVCFYCSDPNDDKCGCAAAYGEYKQTECLSPECTCDYRRRFQGPRGSSWAKPCDLCVPAYRADYAAHMAAISAASVRLADLSRRAEELAPVFLALTAAEQAALLEECGPCNIMVQRTVEEAMTASQIYDMELLRRPP